MSSERISELYRQLRVAQDKYNYFKLAAAGAGIALGPCRQGVLHS